MKVLQLIDSLNPGGAERMAISLANGLAGSGRDSHICVTREEGLLKQTISPDVGYLFLMKKRTLDVGAVKQLRAYIRTHKIDIIHAHSSSFFLASWVKFGVPGLKLIWHDHYGQSELLQQRRSLALKLCSRKFDGIIAVNEKLEQWARENLQCPKVIFLKNFVDHNTTDSTSERLNGSEGRRIICLANFRPQKDHLNLLSAFLKVLEKHPDWTLHLIGKKVDPVYSEEVDRAIAESAVQGIYSYGEQLSVIAMLSQADIGVLSSKSEGLPVALLEYGLAGLAVVATDVGQCKEVIREQGLLVPPGSPDAMADALVKLIEDTNLRQSSAQGFRSHIRKHYSFEAIESDLMNMYLGDV